jgi:hypothetical protein
MYLSAINVYPLNSKIRILIIKGKTLKNSINAQNKRSQLLRSTAGNLNIAPKGLETVRQNPILTINLHNINATVCGERTQHFLTLAFSSLNFFNKILTWVDLPAPSGPKK